MCAGPTALPSYPAVDAIDRAAKDDDLYRRALPSLLCEDEMPDKPSQDVSQGVA